MFWVHLQIPEMYGAFFHSATSGKIGPRCVGPSCIWAARLETSVMDVFESQSQGIKFSFSLLFFYEL